MDAMTFQNIDAKPGDMLRCVTSDSTYFIVGNTYEVFLHRDGFPRIEIEGRDNYLLTTSSTFVKVEADVAEEQPMLDMDLPIISDGGSTDYYTLPTHATEVRHLISAKGMSFARGNLLKALWRLGNKHGTDVDYDLNKMEFFVQDLKEMHQRGERL